MYATCLHCHGALGANEEIETFPVGRKLAFDAAKGRLWVVCPRCARWNLSPLEERWEAVEWCERAYRDASKRVATGEIGLARLKSGLEIVRIGRPLRPEFAAWRYGHSLQERHRQSWFLRARRRFVDEQNTTGMLTLGALVAAGPGLLIGFALLGASEVQKGILRRTDINGIRVGDEPISLKVAHLDAMRFTADGERGWYLEVPHAQGRAQVQGEAALRLLGRLLVYTNDTGGSQRQVDLAVAKLEHFRTSDALLRFMARKNAESNQPLVKALAHEQRLAIEMVAHEESERAALGGELAALETAWREAEEVAAIADNLLLPQRILRRLRGTKQAARG